MKTITKQEFAQIYGQESLSDFQPLSSKRPVGKDVAIGIAKGAGQTIKDAGDVAVAGLKEVLPGPQIPVVSSAIDTAKEAVQGAFGLTEENLQAEGETQQLAKIGTQVATVISPFVAYRLASLASRGVGVAKAAAQPATGVVGRAIEATKGFIKNPRLTLAKQNVDPQLEASANRLFIEGTKRLENPVAVYDEYLDMSKKAINDIKADPAIANVGEKIGDAFKNVVLQRRSVGKTMSNELKAIGDISTDIASASDNFFQSLADEGLNFLDKKLKPVVDQVKMTQSDIQLLETYAQSIEKLGTNPTIKDLDAFLSRIPNEINLYKSKNAIIGTTNAERIIKNSLSSLRDQFDPVKTGNQALKAYSDARKQYSELSDFVEEGARFLGKVTQSGDFAKDASLAKSSVQSILNQGKKDWLDRLEQLTGYPALDDSVLALQAMKDAGDFRGLSLLQQLSETATAPTSIPQKLINYALDKVARAAAGTPAEQTRIFLNALAKGLPK